jgi:hypothetical protein
LFWSKIEKKYGNKIILTFDFFYETETEFNAVLETPLAVETWSDEQISFGNWTTAK